MIVKKRKRMITVSDDWYPCYNDNKVMLGLYIFEDDDYAVKMTVWGADDFGLELGYYNLSKQEAIDTFNSLLDLFNSVPENTNKTWFRDKGFV